MKTGSPEGSRTSGTASVPLIAMSMCSTWLVSSALCSVSMTSQSKPACDRSSATLGLPRPRKQPSVDCPAFSFSRATLVLIRTPQQAANLEARLRIHDVLRLIPEETRDVRNGDLHQT